MPFVFKVKSMLIREIEEKDYEKFEDLFCDYYEEVDCNDDGCLVFDQCVLPELKKGLFSVAVAQDDGEITGFIIYQTDRADNEWCFREGDGDLRELFVSPLHRKHGVGRALVGYAEKELIKSGVKTIFVLPIEESEAFFIHCGYLDQGDYCAELDNKVFEKNA